MNQFDDRSVRRIARVVQQVERLNVNGQPRQKRWPSPGVANVRIAYFEAPAAGIASNATVTCDVIEYSDGSTGEASETIEVHNWVSETVCETADHRGHAIQWGDGWRIMNENRAC